MLNNHPALAIPRETRFLPFVWENRDKWGDLRNDANREKLATQIARRKWTRAGRFGVPPKDLWRRLADAPPTLGSVLGTCFLAFAETTGKSRWGDKRPMYSRYLDAVFSLFPDAQFINVVRDPRAAVASMKKLGWYQGRPGPAIELWDRSVRSVDPWRKFLAPDQLLDVRYEDLVTETEEELRRITGFLGLAPGAIDDMLRYYEDLDETSKKFHSKLRGPVTTSSVDTWTETLTPEEIALVERVAGSLLDRFGYDERSPGCKVPADVWEGYTAQRRKRARERRVFLKHEFKLAVRYRFPIAAQLTSGQRLGLPAGRQPRLLSRVMGRPA